MDIYSVENASLNVHQTAGCRVDGHVHSRYSSLRPTRYVGTPVTKFLGVLESHSTPTKIHRTMKKRGLHFCTISDHDSVAGALEMRQRHPDDAFVSCEYTVRVPACGEGQAVHAGVWGIDYPHGSSRPLPDRAVRELHRDLLHVAEQGYESFTEFCRRSDLAFCLNHPAWQGNPKNPLSGSQMDEITDTFPTLEVNGDCQLENLFAIEIALRKGKRLCAGSDAHSPLRIGHQYTASLHPVDTMAEFLRAFREGQIGIGSSHPMPGSTTESSLADIVKHRFNGTVSNLRKEAYKGVFDYFFSLHDWGTRKASAILGFLGVPGLIGTSVSPELTLPPLFAIQTTALILLPYVMPRIEKMNAAKRTRALYDDYRKHLALKQAESARERISMLKGEHPEPYASHEDHALPDLLVQPNRWDSILLKLLGGLKPLHCDYDMGETGTLSP